MNYSLSELKDKEESENFDFKRFEATDETRKFAKHLVGFANRTGGQIALGLKDNGEPQGKKIDYDQLMKTITNIAYSLCSPQIRFDDEYLKTPEGDIVLIDVYPREEIPHAVVERSEGEIVNRDYWIRTKNSTRRVSDIELNRLFSTTLDPDFSREFDYWGIFSVEDQQPPGIILPDNIETCRSLFRKFDIQEDRIGNLDLIPTLIQELFPFALFTDMSKVYFNTWDTKIKDKRTPLQRSSLLGPNIPTMLGSDNLEQNTNTPTEEIDGSDIQFAKFGDTMLSDFVDSQELIDGLNFHAPPNTEFLVKYSIEDHSDEDVNPFPQYIIRILRDDDFQITIANRGAQMGKGFPSKHPIMDVTIDNNFRRFDIGDIQESWEHAEIRNTLSVEFGYPDIPDTQVDLGERYANRIWHLIEKLYSVDEFLNSLPDTEIFKANYKLDMIIDGLFQ